MKNFLCRISLLTMFLLLISQESVLAQTMGYKTTEQVNDWVRQLTNSHPGKVKTAEIATSPGKRPVYLIEIGNETSSEEKRFPSVFVGANFEGNRPLSTEAAIYLAELILEEPARYDSLNWYILPVGNPDAAARFFATPLYEDSRNDLPTNDDRDELTDEDGVNDLNRDGWITLMRVRHPDGTWIISEKDPRLMKKADPAKGEQGIYKIYTEGIDDDGDGTYNEDGPGGTNVNLNFPFLFQKFTESGGIYPGSTPESYAVMKFVFDHPDIAMIFTFGATNFCMAPPEGGRKGEADMNRLRVPERQAGRFGLDPSRTYTMEELLQTFRTAFPQESIDESDIAGFLGLGAAVNPQEGDLLFYNKYAGEFKEFMKEQGEPSERFEPDQAAEGSPELWGYFHVGVPVFSMDLWGIPKPAKDTVQSKSSKPGQVADESESVEQTKELAMLMFSDSILDKKGFVEWEAYDHPSLGPLEIGGFVPYVFTTPPHSLADSLLAHQVPWVLKLAGELPDLHIFDIKITDLGKGVYQLEAWIENRSFIPFPTAMGNRNRQPAPAVLTLEGDQMKYLSGYQRTPIRSVPGKSRVKLTWVLQSDNPVEITLNLGSKNAGWDQKSIKFGG